MRTPVFHRPIHVSQRNHLNILRLPPTKNQTVEFNMFNILVRKGYYLSYITVLEKKAIVVFFYLLQRAESDSFL